MKFELLVLCLVLPSQKILSADPSYHFINSNDEKDVNSNLWPSKDDFQQKLRGLRELASDCIDSIASSTDLTKTSSEIKSSSASLSPANTASCPTITDDNNLHWPETPAGQEAYPEEFCFTTDAYRLKRLCQSNSTWAPVTQTCEIQNQSKITPELLKLLDKITSATITQLREKTKEYKKFNALDVYLSSQLLLYHYCENEIIFNDVLYTTENILFIDANIMKEAQRKMRAADLWLDATTIATNCNFSGGFERKNFYFVKAGPNDNVAGIQVLQLPDGQNTEKIDRDKSIESVITQKYLKSALWLNSSCLDDSSLYFEAFYTNKYFQDDLQSNVTTDIFKVFRNGNSTDCPYYLIYRKDDNTNDSVDCRYWKRENPVGTWTDSYLTRIESYPNHIVCATNQIGEFSFVVSNEPRPQQKQQFAQQTPLILPQQ